MKTLDDLFLDELKDIYDAEHRLAKALPKMAKAAASEELRAAFTKHLGETENQIKTLEMVFESIGEKAEAKTCQAMVGLMKEADEIAAEFKGSPAGDSALICAAQKVEHYEIATYGCLHEWAGKLGNAKGAKLLAQILGQEEACDAALSEIAVSMSNDTAMDGAGAAATTKKAAAKPAAKAMSGSKS